MYKDSYYIADETILLFTSFAVILITSDGYNLKKLTTIHPDFWLFSQCDLNTVTDSYLLLFFMRPEFKLEDYKSKYPNQCYEGNVGYDNYLILKLRYDLK